MRINRKLYAILIVVFLLTTLFNVSSVALSNQTSNLVDKTSVDDEPNFDGYIIQFNEEPVLRFKNRLKEKIKTFFSHLTEKAADVLLTQNVQNYKDKLLSIHRYAKEDVLKLIGNDLASERTFSMDFTDLFNGIKIKETSVEIVEKIRDLQYVKKVTPDYKISVALDESIPLIDADEIWNYHDNAGKSITGEGISIAIIDTGVDYNHPDLKDNYVKGYDFVNNDNDPIDDHGHGTHCAGIALGSGKTSLMYVGVAPEADLYVYKVLDESGEGVVSSLIAAMEHAVQDGVDIISLSLGGDSETANPDDALSEAADNAVNEGVVVVAAAGNNGIAGIISSPGCARNVTCVGASDYNDKVADFSSRGPVEWNGKTLMKPDIVAPGVDIKSARMGGGYTTKGGTSMATPHVAGAAALMLQINPDLTPEEVKTLLKENAIDLGYEENAQGSGRINVSSSVVINDEIIIKSPYRVTEGGFFSVSIKDSNNNPVKAIIIVYNPSFLPRFKYGDSVSFKAPIIFNPLKYSLNCKIFVINFKKHFTKEVEIIVTNNH